MQFVLLKLNESYYDQYDDYKSPIYLLGRFLTDEIGSGWPTYIKWLNNPKELEIEGNITWLEKWGENILIQSLLYDSEEEMYKNSFTISKEELLKVIDKWSELRQQRPNYIKIINDNGKITMEARKQVEDIENLTLQFKTNKYSVIKATETRIKYFGTFLTNDFQTNPIFFINWVNDLNINYKINGDACVLRRAEYEVLITELILEHKPGSDYTFYIKKNQFIETLNKLHELFSQKVKEINITYKDDIYIIEAIH